MASNKRIHRAWIIVAAGVLIYLTNSGIPANVLPLYIPYLKDMGYTGTQTSSLVTIRCCVSFLGTLAAPFFYKKLKLRTSITFGSLLVVTAELIMAFTHSYAGYVISACLLGFTHGGLAIVLSSIMINNWFLKKRGTAQGITAAGSGISSFIFPIIVTSVAASLSFRSAVLTVAGIAFLLATIIFLTIRDDPAELGLKPYGYGEEPDEKEKQKKKAGHDLDKRDNIVFFAATMILGAASMACYSHYSILFTTTGHTRELTSAVLSFSGAVLMASKFGFGSLVDRIGLKRSSYLCTVMMIVGSVLCMFCTGSDFIPFAALALTNMGLPPASVGLSMWANEFASPEKYSAMMRQNQMAYSLGGLLFTAVPGMIYDHTGSYIPAYALIAVLFLIFGILLIYVYRRFEKRSQLNGGENSAV